MLSPGTEILIYPKPEDVAEAAALLLVELAEGKSQRQLKPRVALAGGSTPKAMYEIFARCSGPEAAALRRVRYFFGDERSVPNSHPDSNVRLAMDGFIHQTGIPSDQVYAPNGAAADLAAEALRLTQVLERTLPKSPINDVPQFDLIFLGMGTDGHTASLFPGTTALDSMAKGYVANDVPQLETKRLTLTFPVLNAAKHLVIMATGANKAKVLSEIFNRTGKNPVYPVEYLAAEKITWMLDFMAASQIPRDLLQRHRSS